MSRQGFRLGARPFVDLIFYNLKVCRTDGFAGVRQAEAMERLMFDLEKTCCWFVIYSPTALGVE